MEDFGFLDEEYSICSALCHESLSSQTGIVAVQKWLVSNCWLCTSVVLSVQLGPLFQEEITQRCLQLHWTLKPFFLSLAGKNGSVKRKVWLTCYVIRPFYDAQTLLQLESLFPRVLGGCPGPVEVLSRGHAQNWQEKSSTWCCNFWWSLKPRSSPPSFCILNLS